MTLTFDLALDHCILCGGKKLEPFEQPQVRGLRMSYVACASCGLVQMSPRPTEEALDEHYAHEYRISLGDVDLSETGDAQRRRSIQQKAFLASTPKRHLDIGCSTGLLLQEIGAAEQVGIEPGQQHREAAEAAGIVMFEDLAALRATDPEPFDLISLSHVVEHLPDPVAFLAELPPLLAPGGRLFVEVPYVYRSIAYELAHLLAFSMPTLIATLKAAGWDVVEERVHVHRQGGLGNGRNLAVIAVPGTPVAPTAGRHDVRILRARRKVGFAPQLFYRWRRRQQRLVTRNLRKVRRLVRL